MQNLLTRKNNPDYVKPLIKNSLIEAMFYSIADDDMVRIYHEKANSDNPTIKASATAYASLKVATIFSHFRDEFLRNGGDLEILTWQLFYKRSK